MTAENGILDHAISRHVIWSWRFVEFKAYINDHHTIPELREEIRKVINEILPDILNASL